MVSRARRALADVIMKAFVVMLLSSSAFAFECPKPIATLSKDVEAKIKGEAEGIGKIIGAGGEANTKVVTRNLIAEFREKSDELAIKLSLISMTCEFLRDMKISDEKKLEELGKLRKDVLSVGPQGGELKDAPDGIANVNEWLRSNKVPPLHTPEADVIRNFKGEWGFFPPNRPIYVFDLNGPSLGSVMLGFEDHKVSEAFFSGRVVKAHDFKNQPNREAESRAARDECRERRLKLEGQISRQIGRGPVLPTKLPDSLKRSLVRDRLEVERENESIAHFVISSPTVSAIIIPFTTYDDSKKILTWACSVNLWIVASEIL